MNSRVYNVNEAKEIYVPFRYSEMAFQSVYMDVCFSLEIKMMESEIRFWCWGRFHRILVARRMVQWSVIFSLILHI